MRQVGVEKRELAGRRSERQAFWSELLYVSQKRHALHAGVSPSATPYLVTSSGVPGLSFAYCAFEDHMRVELYIARGDEEQSDRAFRALEAHKDDIEHAFGEPLVWQLLSGKKSCRVKHELTAGSYRDTDRWPEIIDKAIDAMVRLEGAIRPHLHEVA